VTTSHETLETNRIYRKLLIPLSIILTLLIAGFVTVLMYQQQNTFRAETKHMLMTVSQEMEISLAAHTELIEALQESAIRIPGIVEALKMQDEERLFAACKEMHALYKKKYSITHFYFHNANRVNILRVHKPEKRGDLIDRFTARIAERTGKVAAGIELGPLGTFTLRVVKPIYDGEALIGYLELGKEIEDILVQITRKHDVEMTATIHKDRLSRENWERGMSMLEREADWHALSQEVIIYSTYEIFPKASKTEDAIHKQPQHHHQSFVYSLRSHIVNR